MAVIPTRTLGVDRPVGRCGGIRPARVLLGGFLLLSFGIFKFFPGMGTVNVAWLVVLALFLLFGYLPYKALREHNFDMLELYVAAMMVVVPAYAGLIATVRFGQPLTYGVLSQRWILNGAVTLFICIGLHSGRLSLRDVERTLITYAWVLLALYIVMTVALEPAGFASYEGFVSGGGVEPYTFKFDNTLIVFAFLYYAFKGYRAKCLTAYIAAAVFLAYLVLVAGGRSQILALLGSFVFFAVRWSSGARRVAFVPKALVAAAALTLLLFAVAPSYMQDLAGRTGAAINVVVDGQFGEDASANARIEESAVAEPYVKSHWLLGNGSISNQWHGGYQGVLGTYFYPSDIGFLGILFVFGLLGALLFALPLEWAWRAGRRLTRCAIHTPLTDALFGYLLYMAVRSLVTGELVWAAAVCWTFVMILQHASRELPMIETMRARYS